MFGRRNNNIKSEKGASAVEFALILPILLMLVFAIFEFGIAYNNYISLTHAAREGARLAAVNRDEIEGLDWFEARVKNSSPTITDKIESITLSGEDGDIGDPVSVTVTMAAFIIEIPFAGTYGPITLSNTATLRIEQ